MKDRFPIITTLAFGIIGLSSLLLGQNPPLYPRTSPGSTAATTTGTRDASKTGEKKEKGNLSSADKSFIKGAAKGGMMEVAMGREAEKNASDAEVKKFGARMVTDHSKANDELKSLAKEEGVELPAEKEPGKWKSDKDYMSTMVKDHEKDLADFEKEAKDGTDPDVKTFAEKTSKIIRKHLEMAKEIDGKLK
jgi:putative membrane protein